MGGQGEFDGKGEGVGDVTADDADAMGVGRITKGQAEMKVERGGIVQQGDGAVPGQDFQGANEG